MNTISLMYHDVYVHDTNESGFQNSTGLKYKISATKFEQQIAWLDVYLREHELPTSCVELTFDDGGISFITVVAPILEKYGFRGIFFISTGYIGSERFLSVDQIQELVSRGHIIGSHSHSHPERICSMSKKEISDEWTYSQMLLSEILPHNPTIASIPNGYCSKEVIECMANAGIDKIYTSDPTTKRTKRHNAAIIGRYVITDEDSLDSFILLISSKKKRFNKWLKFKILSMLKVVLGDAYLTIRKKLIR